MKQIFYLYDYVIFLFYVKMQQIDQLNYVNNKYFSDVYELYVYLPLFTSV